LGAALLNGGASAGLVALIASALSHGERPTLTLLGGFLALIVLKLATNATSDLLLHRFAENTLAELCRDLTRRVVETPLRRLEQVGIPRILEILDDDVPSIAYAIQQIPNLALQAAIIVGCSLYLAWLSWSAFVCIVALIGFGALGYRALVQRAYSELARARVARESLLETFYDVTEGAKELKLHADRREAFLREKVGVTTENLRRLNLSAHTRLLVASSWSQVLFYLLVGGLLFMAPRLSHMSSEALTGYVLTTLYMMNPVWGLMASWPVWAEGRIALSRTQELGLSLATPDPAVPSVTVADRTDNWKRLELDGVVFSYESAGGDSNFVLGPIDLTLSPREVVFIVGGNGSGKSTLMKVVTGLYEPQSGEIRLDGRSITNENRAVYQQLFSVVFADFHLFDRLLGLDPSDLDARAHRLLVELQLDSKVAIRQGFLSTTALSQGQRKRLALLTSLLEDRPIYVFDEWAADQDPQYRDAFYNRRIPELRAAGKTVLVITHDDRYYHLADRIIKLDYGKLSG
jgi:putative ATP-binding cassette transporter